MKKILFIITVLFAIVSCGNQPSVKYYQKDGHNIASLITEDDGERSIIMIDNPYEEEEIMEILDFFELGQTDDLEKISIYRYTGKWDEVDRIQNHAELWEFYASTPIENPEKYKNLKYCRLSRCYAMLTEKMKQEEARASIESLKEFIERYKSFVADMDKETAPAEIASYARTFEKYTEVPEELKGTEYEKEAKKLVATIKSKSPTFYTKCRSIYAKLAKKALWRQNIKVKQSGTTIFLIGGLFASNANIEDTFLGIRDVLQEVKFKKVIFQWSEYAEGTYYLLD